MHYDGQRYRFLLPTDHAHFQMALAFGNLESQTERLLLLTHLIRFLGRTARLLEHQVLHLQVLRHEEVLEA